MMTTYLNQKNPHIRDESIVFTEFGHKYTITTDIDSKYISVTTWCHSHFPKFDADKIIDGMMRNKSNWKPGHKYWGLTKQEIKDMWNQNGASVSSAGTDLHSRIEEFMNREDCTTHLDILTKYDRIRNESSSSSDAGIFCTEWEYFLNFVRDTPNLKPYRTEWMIHDTEMKLAGSIDMIYENEDGTLSIYDWKRCKSINRVNLYNKFALTPCISEMHDTNFWHYALQLNTYRMILERNYEKRVTELYLVQLHPESDENNYVVIPIPILQVNMDELFTLYTTTTEDNMPTKKMKI